MGQGLELPFQSGKLLKKHRVSGSMSESSMCQQALQANIARDVCPSVCKVRDRKRAPSSFVFFSERLPVTADVPSSGQHVPYLSAGRTGIHWLNFGNSKRFSESVRTASGAEDAREMIDVQKELH